MSVSAGCLCVRSASVTCVAVEGGPGALLAAALLAALQLSLRAAIAPGDTLRGHGCGETPCLELILSRPFSHRAMGTQPFPSCVHVSRDFPREPLQSGWSCPQNEEVPCRFCCRILQRFGILKIHCKGSVCIIDVGI